MFVLSFESFIEETWDYVSEYVVSDDYWEQNEKFIRAITHTLYTQYKKNLKELGDGTIQERLTPKTCGKLIEGFFSELQKIEKI